MRLETEVATARREGDDIVLDLTGDQSELRVDRVLVAVGRTPNLEDLDLDAAGIEHDDRHIPVNDRFQTNVSHVYAAGDIIGGPQFTHLAGFQAAHATRNIFLPVKSKFDPGPLPWVTFTDPEVGHVGITEQEATATDADVTIVRFPYSHNERAVTDNDDVGLMKFLIDDSRHIVGCHIVGAHAGELINEITLAMKHDITVDGIVGTDPRLSDLQLRTPDRPDGLRGQRVAVDDRQGRPLPLETHLILTRCRILSRGRRRLRGRDVRAFRVRCGTPR